MTARVACRGAGVGVVSLALLITLFGSAAAAPEAETPSIRDRVAQYQAARARAGDFLLSPLEVVERLLRRRAITVLDVRSRGRFKAVHLRGARSFPLQELFRAIRTGRVPGRVLIVVDDTGDQAIEVMVALRLTGREAFAMAGGMTSLRRLLAGSLQVPERSPVSGHAAQARALLVGSSAGSALEPADRWSIPAPVGLAAAVLLAAVLYVRARLARRRRRPLVEAFGIIERNQLSYFGHAAGTLQGALGSGRLRRREAAEARFGLAYVRARSGRLRSASEDLDQLIASGHRDPYALHLDLWVKVQQGDDEAAAARYQESSEQLARLLPSRELASIASLRLARRALAARKLDDTLKRFSEVRNLAVLAARLPEGLEDLPTAFAVEALQDDRVPDAADRFQRAAAAAEPGSDQALAARLGTLLCRWRQRGGPLPEGFQDELAATAEQVRAGIGAAEPDDGDDPDERRLLLRNLLLWQAVACIAGWLSRPEGRGLPASERARLYRLLEELRRVDSSLADPYLLDGLVGYAFASSDTERDRAVEALEQARLLGVRLPEVVSILAREQGRTGSSAGGPEEWADAVRRYLSDPRAPLELRRRLQQLAAGLTRHAPLLREDLELAEFQVVPTLGDLQNRGLVLQRRVRRLLLLGPPDAGWGPAREVDQLMEQLQTATQSLESAAKAFTRVEWELIVRTGSLLLAGEHGTTERGSDGTVEAGP
jgi:rhodanese-related sulfurtransferase